MVYTSFQLAMLLFRYTLFHVTNVLLVYKLPRMVFRHMASCRLTTLKKTNVHAVLADTLEGLQNSEW